MGGNSGSVLGHSRLAVFLWNPLRWNYVGFDRVNRARNGSFRLCARISVRDIDQHTPRSSRGLGRRPFTPVTRVQIPYAVQSPPLERMAGVALSDLQIVYKSIDFKPIKSARRNRSSLRILVQRCNRVSKPLYITASNSNVDHSGLEPDGRRMGSLGPINLCGPQAGARNRILSHDPNSRLGFLSSPLELLEPDQLALVRL